MLNWSLLKGTFYRFASIAILVAMVGMFVVLSCGGGPVQFNTGFNYNHTSQSCEEHIVQAGDIHTEKSIFDSVTVPNGKTFVAAILVAVLIGLFPALPERYSLTAKIALIYHQRKRWVWARHTPFASFSFVPYFAATRDQ